MKKFRVFYFFCICIISPLSLLFSQNLLINEIVASNSEYLDNFSGTPDWIEIYNSDSEAIDLNGYRLSDDPDYENAWQFGNVIIGPGQHLLIFASGRDISDKISYETIINRGMNWRYIIPDQEISDEWKNIGFNDTEWMSGNSGFGYGDGDDNTLLPAGTRSVYIRRDFPIQSVEEIQDLILHVDYDDAFIAYLNGKEVARANIGAPGDNTAYNAFPLTDHEALMHQGLPPDMFRIGNVLPFINEGQNVLAIQAFNISVSSSDFTIIPFLTMGRKIVKQDNVPAILTVPESQLHADFRLNAEGETVFLFSNEGQILDSIQYPALEANLSYGRVTDADEEWVVFEIPTPGNQNDGDYFEGINPDSIQFSHKTGIYQGSISVELSGSSFIRYTLDGSEPQETSTLYNSAITIDQNSILQAKIFEEGLLGKLYSENYLFDVSHELPVISLHIEPSLLWDNDQGMYVLGDSYQEDFPFFGANFWEDWEYPFSMSYFAPEGNLLYKASAGGKIFGGWSRAFGQKSFSLFARAVYGTNDFEYPFFESRPYDQFESIILRNSGNDWDRSFIRDAVMTTLMAGTEVDYPAYQPVVSYLNGEYWGMYNMREKISEHFLASLHNVDPDDIDLLENNGLIKHGDNTDYLNLISFINNNSLASDVNYQMVINQIDEISFIQYQLAQIYYDNKDWPGNNIRYWRAGDGKWRWILYDTDFGLSLFNPFAHLENTLEFATATNGPAWPNPPWSTLLLRKLLENIQFRQKFVNYFADAMNSYFLPENTHEHIDTLVEKIETEIVLHRQRWGHDLQFWYDNIQQMKSFFSLRPAVARDFILHEFNFPAVQQIRTFIDNPEFGYIQLNSLRIAESNWSGLYFQNNPVHLTAIPLPGFRFDRWTGDVVSTDPSIEINLTRSSSINAHFLPAEVIENQIVINEINYNSSPDADAGDWIELHNHSGEIVNLSGWILKDNDDLHAFEFPDNTLLEGRDYLVVCRDLELFQSIHPFVQNRIGELDFGFSSNDDAVRLYDQGGVLHDEVHYSSSSPWPEEANGEGPTLELISPDLDNSLPSSWQTYEGNGTPGRNNQDMGNNNGLISILPNPTLGEFWIESGLTDTFISKVDLFDMFGNLVLSRIYSEATSTTEFNISGSPTGHYLAIVQLSDGEELILKFQKVK